MWDSCQHSMALFVKHNMFKHAAFELHSSSEAPVTTCHYLATTDWHCYTQPLSGQSQINRNSHLQYVKCARSLSNDLAERADCCRTVTDLEMGDNMLGVIVAGISVVSSGMQQIFCRTMQQKHKLSSQELLANTAPAQVGRRQNHMCLFVASCGTPGRYSDCFIPHAQHAQSPSQENWLQTFSLIATALFVGF